VFTCATFCGFRPQPPLTRAFPRGAGFRVRSDRRCNDHYKEVIPHRGATIETCLDVCRQDEQCAKATLRSNNTNAPCYLFDERASCTSAQGWSTVFTGVFPPFTVRVCVGKYCPGERVEPGVDDRTRQWMPPYLECCLARPGSASPLARQLISRLTDVGASLQIYVVDAPRQGTYSSSAARSGHTSPRSSSRATAHLAVNAQTSR
jgi:hypothetical protein